VLRLDVALTLGEADWYLAAVLHIVDPEV